MLQRLFNLKIFFLIISLSLLVSSAWALEPQPESNPYLDSAKLVAQQVELLKARYLQARNQVIDLQRQQEKQLATLSLDHVNKEWLNQIGLNISVAKSNLDSINIELSESQQTLTRLEKDIQEVENQLNVFSIFGLKIAHNEIPNVHNLQSDLIYQKNLLQLEKTRNDYLFKLHDIADSTLQLYKAKYTRINTLLKSRTIVQLKEQQARSEVFFQQQQSYWLKRLNELSSQLNKLELNKSKDKDSYVHLEREIFYANENVNFTYLQMLIARYQDKIQQLKVSLSRGNSITLLNKVSEQAQSLGKQLLRVNDLLQKRAEILEQRKTFSLSQMKGNDIAAQLSDIGEEYKIAINDVVNLTQQLASFRLALDQALQHELSSRQGLPGFSATAWLDLGNEIGLVPTLSFQIVISLVNNVGKALNRIAYEWWLLLACLELVWFVTFRFINKKLTKWVSGMADHEHGHVNYQWLFAKLLQRNLVDVAVISNLVVVFIFCGIPFRNFSFLTNLALVWLFVKIIITAARLCLVDTVHDSTGHHVRSYYRLKWLFVSGGIITALTVFVNQLPVIYELKDFFNRAFLLFLLVVSIFFLKAWKLIPGLVLPYIDPRRPYFKRVVYLLGILIPLILLVNSLIGLFGFVNLVMTISWYESIFLFVLVGYLVLRGFLTDGMMWVSNILISHVSNGWLWTEAFLKPLDRVLRVALFFSAWIALFLCYRWDQQPRIVERCIQFLNYHLADLLNTSITPLSILELLVAVAFWYWVARWTREFVYRLLLKRTPDIGLRNSIATFSQYGVVLIGVFFCLRVLGIDFRALTVVAGAFAFGVGLGLRDLANNFACGFLLLIERPLRVGDTITIGGYEGEVTHIGGRAVTVRTWDHMDVLVPNAEVFSKSFTNWTAKDSIVRTVIAIKINRYDSPHDVQTLIHKVLASHKNVLNDPMPEVLLTEMSEALVEFEVRYFVNLRQVTSRIGVRSEVLIAIWAAFEKHGIKPPYPHHEITLKNGLPMLGPDGSYEIKGLV